MDVMHGISHHACPTNDWAHERFLKMARSVQRVLRNMPASGIFDQQGLENVWDEYCLQVQFGPPDLEMAWSATIDPIVDYEVKQLTVSEAAALTAWRHGVEDEVGDRDPDGYNPEMLRAAVLQELSDLAYESEFDWTSG
jgi:hypothetical protein